MVTPLNVNLFEKLLKDSNYDAEESSFLIDGFHTGFDIGYKGPKTRQSTARNIPFTPGVGDKWELWSKIMKEVRAGRFAGPFDVIPFDNYIQSPVGLVPKHGNKIRLIFHLSYDFTEDYPSVNTCTPREDCSVKYNDLDHAIMNCLQVSQENLSLTGRKTVFLGKTDLSMAFRVLPMKICCLCWLVLMAENPKTRKFQYFVDKCLPIGASISCSHYQRFSNALRHIIVYRTKRKSITNYLDDFLFAALTKLICNFLINSFLSLCGELNLPVAIEKTEWASTLIVFLGILLDGEWLLLSIPLEKQEKALRMLNDLTGKKRVTVKQLQVLTGYLNFLTKAIHAGRTFTRCMYAKYTNRNRNLKQHHHIKIDNKFRFDCETWRIFLTNFRDQAVCRLMMDLSKSTNSVELDFYSDALAAEMLGWGGCV